MGVGDEAGAQEKWKVARELADTIMSAPDSVPTETLDSFETIAKALNEITD